MSTPDREALDGTPWNLAVDEEAGELHIEHVESGDAYVFDDEGNLQVPGDGDIEGSLHEVRDALASALDESDGDEAQTSSGECSVRCDEETGELRLESEEGITLDAPTIDIDPANELNVTPRTLDVRAVDVTLEGQRTTDLSAKGKLTVSSKQEVAVNTTNKITLDGTFIRATASGPMTLEGALIKLN